MKIILVSFCFIGYTLRMNIGWIGTGIMGSAMARHFVQTGHTVTAYNRTFEKVEALRSYGIIPAKSIGDCVKDAEVVFSIVGYPQDVEEIYLGEGGIFQYAQSNAMLIDMTTSSPLLAKKLYNVSVSGESGKYFKMLDAPVSGGDSGARSATLSIMVGGEKEYYDEALPLFEIIGKNINYLGVAGSGQHCKACNQIAVAGNVVACAEAITYAKSNGLDPTAVLAAISKGAAGSWQMDNNAPRMVEGDYGPYFMNEHFLKDLKIAQSAMREVGKNLPALDIIADMYEKLVENGHGKEGTQSILQNY